jgi:hypothetical protein
MRWFGILLFEFEGIKAVFITIIIYLRNCVLFC